MVQGKTVTVVTIEDHTYDGVPHAVGDRYEAEEGHIEFLQLRGYAQPAVPPPEVPQKSAPRKK